MSWTEPLLDAWAALSHKPALGKGSPPTLTGVPGPQPHQWVGEHRRRLTAYMMLHAYRENVSRWYVKASSETQRDIRREYGDADLLIRQTAASVLGRGARLAIPGTEDQTSGPAASRLDEMGEWALDEQLNLKLLEIEQTCLELGDVVIHLTYSARQSRVRMRMWDPGFYFPVYPPGEDTEDYPRKVHLAWEFEEWTEDERQKRQKVERITYELIDVPPYTVTYQSEPATQVCVMTDAVWDMDALNWGMLDLGPDGFTPSGARYRTNDEGAELNRLPLGIDFIPVIHVPNFGGKPFGRSILTSVAHILDDIQMADTDAAEAADVAGGPPIVVAGATQDELKLYGPKTVFFVPTGGQASVLDTSKGLESLHAHIDFLYGRLTTNARVPEEILGRVGANEVPSGTALALSFSPFKVLIEELRLTRGHKYGLVLKFLQRMMIAHNQWRGDVEAATLEFGAALPEDIHGLVAILKELAAADRPLMSRTTALAALADAGLPIEDIAEEMERIHGEDYDAARLIAVATKSGQLAAEHLGLELPDVDDDPTMAQLIPPEPVAPGSGNTSGTVTNNKNTSGSPRAGTGTRNPGATSGSTTNNERSKRSRRGPKRG